MTKRLVVDTTVIIKWLNRQRELNIEQADKILKEAYEAKVTLFAPEVAKYEIGKVLLKGKELTQTESKTPLSLLFDLPIQFVALSPGIVKESFAIAHAYKLSYSEGIFLALSEEKKAVYLTEKAKSEYADTGVSVAELRDY